MNIEFSQPTLFAKVNQYQGQLENALVELGTHVEDLKHLRGSLNAKRAALILQSKKGIQYEGKLLTTSNKEEREAIVTTLLADEINQEEWLEDKIDYLKECIKSYRALISAEQSKLSVEKSTADLLNYNQGRET